MTEEFIPIPHPDCVRFVNRKRPIMNDLNADTLRSDLIAKMLELEFWLGSEILQIPDITENPEKVMQFRRTDNAEVHIVIKR